MRRIHPLIVCSTMTVLSGCQGSHWIEVDIRPGEPGNTFFLGSLILVALIATVGHQVIVPLQRWSSGYGAPILSGLVLLLEVLIALATAPAMTAPILMAASGIAAIGAIVWLKA